MDLAIERGEVVGRAGSLLSWTARKQDWIRDGKVTYILQMGLTKSKEIPEVPLLLDLAKTERARQMYELLSSASAVGRSMFGPPEIPAARATVLRTAFDKMVADPSFIAAATKRGMPVNPSKGAEIQEIIAKTINAPKDAVEVLRKTLGM